MLIKRPQPKSLAPLLLIRSVWVRFIMGLAEIVNRRVLMKKTVKFLNLVLIVAAVAAPSFATAEDVKL